MVSGQWLWSVMLYMLHISISEGHWTAWCGHGSCMPRATTTHRRPMCHCSDSSRCIYIYIYILGLRTAAAAVAAADERISLSGCSSFNTTACTRPAYRWISTMRMEKDFPGSDVFSSGRCVAWGSLVGMTTAAPSDSKTAHVTLVRVCGLPVVNMACSWIGRRRFRCMNETTYVVWAQAETLWGTYSLSDPPVVGSNREHRYYDIIVQAETTGVVPTVHDSVRCPLNYSYSAKEWIA